MWTVEDVKSLTSRVDARPASMAEAPGASVIWTDPLDYQRHCSHPSSRWVHGRSVDRRVCRDCHSVLEEGWPDHHPEVSRWLNEGGAICP